jgi:hypothetical protein
MTSFNTRLFLADRIRSVSAPHTNSSSILFKVSKLFFFLIIGHFIFRYLQVNHNITRKKTHVYIWYNTRLYTVKCVPLKVVCVCVCRIDRYKVFATPNVLSLSHALFYTHTHTYVNRPRSKWKKWIPQSVRPSFPPSPICVSFSPFDAPAQNNQPSSLAHPRTHPPTHTYVRVSACLSVHAQYVTLLPPYLSSFSLYFISL